MRGHSVGIFFTLNISSFDYLNKERHVIIDLFIDLFCIFKYWRFLEKFHAVPILREFYASTVCQEVRNLIMMGPRLFPENISAFLSKPFFLPLVKFFRTLFFPNIYVKSQMQSFFVFLCLAGFLITFSFTKKGKIHFRWVSKFLLVVQKSLFVCGKKKLSYFNPCHLHAFQINLIFHLFPRLIFYNCLLGY